MKQAAILLFIICSLSLFAENKLAVIRDSMEYVSVYKGKGTNYEIVTTIDKDDFFYCDLIFDEEWIKIMAMEWKNGKQMEGFVHKNDILLVENLEIEKQKELIFQVLTKQKQLADDFYEYCNSSTILDTSLSIIELEERIKIVRKGKENHSETKYDPILDFLPTYFCSTQDTTIIQLLFITMLADHGSASEMPSFAIGKCYVCYPDLIMNQLNYLKNKEDKDFILNKIEWGLETNFYHNSNIEYDMLQSKLHNERKNNE